MVVGVIFDNIFVGKKIWKKNELRKYCYDWKSLRGSSWMKNKNYYLILIFIVFIMGLYSV